MTTQTWWLSFCDPDRPTGQQFLGALVLDVEWADVAMAEGITIAIRASHGLPPLDDPDVQWMAGAVYKAHRLRVNPGGAVAARRFDDVPGFATHSARYPRGVLLSRADIAAIDAVITQADT
jgi:hypothetical protein